ncbi:MAG: AraC family transcriptional regulator [Flavobacteriaceae bacterium]|jgi:AraC-like DNA-binding protein|nr:AraC family transcriptional regulator [Flavobacteriaceae bacterium]
MHIKSSIKEINETILELDIPDEPNPDTGLNITNICEYSDDTADINCRVQYTSGLCIIETDFYIRKPITDIFTVMGDYICLPLLVTGESRIITEQNDIDKGLIQLFYQKQTHMEIKMQGNEERVSYLAIIFSRNFYTELLSGEKWANKDDLYTSVKNGDFISYCEKRIPVNYSIYQILQEIKSNSYEGIYKKYFIETKLRELFFVIHVSYVLKSNSYPGIKPDVIQKLEKAKGYLGLHFNESPTIKQLSRIVFLNEFKLKSGFKLLFGSTIHEYVIRLRMKKAKEMLLKNYSVNEISAYLGYKSTSHFIGAFKKYYGETPKRYLLTCFR